jgi:hypothetical protein
VPDEELTDPVLPPAEVTVRNRQTGGTAVSLVLVTFALAPFVQAIAAAFGTKLAGAIDGATRDAVRRMLGRAHNPTEASKTPLPPVVSVALTGDAGTRVLLDDQLPAEAVAQLVHMATGPGVGAGSVFWRPKGDAGGRWHLESDGEIRAVWNRANRQWQARDA